MSVCSSCGFKWPGAGAETSGRRCPKCGVGAEGGGEQSLGPVLGGVLVLTSLIAVVLGVITWTSGAGLWFVVVGVALLLGGIALIARR